MQIKRICWIAAFLSGLYLHTPNCVHYRFDQNGRLRWHRAAKGKHQ